MVYSSLCPSRLAGSIGLSARAACTVVCLLLLPLTVHAQGFGRVEGTETNVGTYHYFVQPGAATVQIYVVGGVNQPGIYELSQGTDLQKALALAGGIEVGIRPVTTRRRVTVRLLRPQAGELTPIYEQRLDVFLSGLAEAPVLQDGDVISLEVIERQRLDWRDILRVVTATASVTLAIDRLARRF